MAVEINDHEEAIIDAVRETVMEMLRDQEVEIIRRIRARIGGEQFYLPKDGRGDQRADRDAAIRQDRAAGLSIRALAKKHNISPGHVMRVLQTSAPVRPAR